MKASETSIRILLEGQKQFQVPLFQRPYGWREAHWATLWADILDTLASDSDTGHFLGPIVTKSLPGTPEGVSPFLVIDGQQRLTTLVVLLAAIRDTFASRNPQLAAKFNDLYIGNRFVTGLSKYKVLPTQVDRDSLFAIIDGPEPNGSTPIHRAYRFFRARLAAPDLGGLDPGHLERTVLGGLHAVSVTLGSEDNEYRIFESLNAKGMPLRQVDLLKNYLFMRLPLEQQQVAYASLWRPMEDRLGAALEDFFRYEFLSSGEFVREGDVYQAWQKRLNSLDATEVLHKIEHFSKRADLYARLVQPELEPDAKVAAGLRRLYRWGSQTLHPFLLTAYQAYSDGALSEDEMASLLETLESFLIRRLFAGVPTNALNRLFLRLAYQLPPDLGFIAGVRHVLSLPSRRWPRDAEFKDGILRYPLYTDSRPEQRRLIVEAFERQHHHKEAPALEGLSIEHIMPQALTDEWRSALGSDADNHRRLLHVIGNLTLTGYNPELSNSPWEVKRELLRKSNLEMNKEIASKPSWDARAILARGAELAERALELWPSPEPLSDADEPEDAEQPEAGPMADFYLGCIGLIAPRLDTKLVPVTNTLFRSPGSSLAVVCLVSREYEGGGYWWTFRTRHQKALESAQAAYLALGCGSPSQTLLFTFSDWKPILDRLNSTVHGAQTNWHIQIHKEGNRMLLRQKASLPDLDVTNHLLDDPQPSEEVAEQSDRIQIGQ